MVRHSGAVRPSALGVTVFWQNVGLLGSRHTAGAATGRSGGLR
jgi:hypothetical protein